MAEQEVHPAPLPATALEHAPDLRRQPQVGNPSGESFAYGDHQLGSSQATLLLLRRSLRLEGAEEMAPVALRLAVAHGNAEHLAVAEGIDADRHHDGPRHHLHVLSQTAVEVGGIEEDVQVVGMV